MAKSVEEIRRESVRFSNACINNEIRKRLTQGFYFDEVRELEFIERRIQQTKENITYYYGGFALDADVVAMIDELRKKCVAKLRKDAAFELECYEKRKAKGESLSSIEYLRTQAANHTAKANSIQRTLDAIEAEKRRAAEQKAAEERRKAEQAAKRQEQLNKVKKYSLPVILVVVLLIIGYSVLDKMVIQPRTYEKNFEIFKAEYESNLIPVLEEYSLTYSSIEYTELVPDYDLDYWETERINEYEVWVYFDCDAPSSAKIYEIIGDINWANHNYLLSNTYELLDDGEYVRDDTKETGFHDVNTLLIFNDGCKYKKDFQALYKDGKEEWKKNSTYTPPSSNKTDNAPSGECMYPECDHNRAPGKYYCHQHKCSESGCSTSTSLLIDYCDQHNCTYGSCSAPRYKAVGSTYCQRHYIESQQD